MTAVTPVVPTPRADSSAHAWSAKAPELSTLARWAAAVLAVDAAAIGGARVRAAAGPLRDAWLAALRGDWPADRPWQRLPLAIGDDRLLGGLDLVATLAQGRAVMQRGLLAECDGGLAVVPMAERLGTAAAAQLALAVDRGEVIVEREGFAARHATRIGVLALDEAGPDDAPLVPALAERLAIDVCLAAPVGDASGEGGGAAKAPEPWPAAPAPAAVARARRHWPQVVVPVALLETLCAAALALGVDSLRRSFLALQVLRIVTALAGREEAGEDELALALALAVVPHATRMPAAAEDPADHEPPPDEGAEHAADDREQEPAPPDQPAEPGEPAQVNGDLQTLTAAALARLPPGLLASLATQAALARNRSAREGASGGTSAGKRRGRSLGARPGDPRQGQRLSLIDTLRAAAPWQRLRRPAAAEPAAAPRLQLRRDDLRVTRRAQRRASTTLFVIDASGSAALHRLAEAKGAVELLLAESYVRRDEVAVIAFRGQGAQLVLPPTRSLVRAKRALAGLPGGGGTPLAAALDAARELAEQVQRHGATPSVVLLSDGRANVPRMSPGAAGLTPPPANARATGSGRARAEADALAAAARLAASGVRCLVIDTSPQPGESARRIAERLHAAYLPLPHARAEAVSGAARALRERAAPAR